MAFTAKDVWERMLPDAIFSEEWTEFRHRQLGNFLHELVRSAPTRVTMGRAGSSAEGRTLYTIRLGREGGRRVLVWARQHGDEPDCSAALCCVLRELTAADPSALAEEILDRLDIVVFPMVNPDGVARFTRESSHGIDLNRDAVALATPEAQALFRLKEEFEPEFCFNLHDMSPRKARRDGTLVSLAFQAGPYDETDQDNEVRLRAKQVSAIMAECVAPWAPENVARYDADYMHRAFGDSMMRWGVSSILVEAGGWYGEDGDTFVRRLFAVSVLRGLHAIAGREDDNPTPHAYDAIPLDSSRRFADVLIAGGMVDPGQGRAPFRADVHIDVLAKAEAFNQPVLRQGRIMGMGDLADMKAKELVDAKGKLIVPGFTVLAPNIVVSGTGPSHEVATGFLRAGITTIACGFGPYPTNSQRQDFLNVTSWDVRPNPPLGINIVPFEIVSSVDDIRSRHGQTELAGFLVKGLVMDAGELMRFSQLFHPATTPPPESEGNQRLIGIDLFFINSTSPATSQLRLVLTSIESEGARQRVQEVKLRRFASDFLRHPAQIALACDGQTESFSWLPVLVDACGYGSAGAPERDFFGRVLAHQGGHTADAISSTLTMLTRRPSRVLRLYDRGTLEKDMRGDLAIFDMQGSENATREMLASFAPSTVLLNGEVVVDVARNIAKPGRGRWTLSGGAAK